MILVSKDPGSSPLNVSGSVGLSVDSVGSVP